MEPLGNPVEGGADTLKVDACTNTLSFWGRVLNAAARAGNSLVEDLAVHHNRSSPEEHPAVNKENIFWYVILWLVSVSVIGFIANYVSNFPNKRRDARARARMRLLLKHRVLSSTANRLGDKSTSAAASMLKKVVLPDEAVVLRTDLFGPSDLSMGAALSPDSGDAWYDESASSNAPSDVEGSDVEPVSVSTTTPPAAMAIGASASSANSLAGARQTSENELSKFFKAQAARQSSDGQRHERMGSEAEDSGNKRRSSGSRSRSQSRRKRDRSCAATLKRQRQNMLNFFKQVSVGADRSGDSAAAGGTPVEAGAAGASRHARRKRRGGDSSRATIASSSSHGSRRGNLRTRKRQIVVPERLPHGCEPVIVFINSKSGGLEGAAMIEEFKRYLHPLQVWDLAHGSPALALEPFLCCERLRLLACGGDGTVAWILKDAVDGAVEFYGGSMRSLPTMSVACLPLGTGNDLSRVLGWGSKYLGESVDEILLDVCEAQHAMLDRWNIRITQRVSPPPSPVPNAATAGVEAHAEEENTSDPADDQQQSTTTASAQQLAQNTNTEAASANSPSLEPVRDRSVSGGSSSSGNRSKPPSAGSEEEAGLQPPSPVPAATDIKKNLRFLGSESSSPSELPTLRRLPSRLGLKDTLGPEPTRVKKVTISPPREVRVRATSPSSSSMSRKAFEVTRQRLLSDGAPSRVPAVLDRSSSGSTGASRRRTSLARRGAPGHMARERGGDDGGDCQHKDEDGSGSNSPGCSGSSSSSESKRQTSGTAQIAASSATQNPGSPAHQPSFTSAQPTSRPRKLSGRAGGDVQQRILFSGGKHKPPGGVSATTSASAGGRVKANVVMNNYFGIGLGAEITLRFHEMRERHPSLFFSRFINRMWYTQGGISTLFEKTVYRGRRPSHRRLSEVVSLWCDGRKVNLEGLEGIVFLNIRSYSAGVDLWRSANDPNDVGGGRSPQDQSEHSEGKTRYRPGRRHRDRGRRTSPVSGSETSDWGGPHQEGATTEDDIGFTSSDASPRFRCLDTTDTELDTDAEGAAVCATGTYHAPESDEVVDALDATRRPSQIQLEWQKRQNILLHRQRRDTQHHKDSGKDDGQEKPRPVSLEQTLSSDCQGDSTRTHPTHGKRNKGTGIMSAIAKAIARDLDGRNDSDEEGDDDTPSPQTSNSPQQGRSPAQAAAPNSAKRREKSRPRKPSKAREYGQFHTSGHNSCSDGLLEVVGIFDETQLAKMQVGLSGAVRLAQCSDVRIHIREEIAAQVDGEPWLQAPGSIKLKLHGQASMLRKPQEFSENSVGELINILDATSGANIISPQQRTRIVREILRLNNPSRNFVRSQ